MKSCCIYHHEFILFQITKLQGRENVLYSCFSDTDDEAEVFAAAEYGGTNQDDSSGNDSTAWLELDGPQRTDSEAKQNVAIGTIVRSRQLELEVRQNIYDLLQYIDNLERQVGSCAFTIIYQDFAAYASQQP